jgi:ribosomal protein S27E
MTKSQAMLGGPGLCGYAFRADTYCVPCGQEHINTAPQDYFSDSRSLDTDHVPQPIFFGEADTAQHCADCGEYLYGPKGEDAQ